MDYSKLLSKFYPSGYIILCGIIALIYGVMIFVYIQQGIAQKDLNEQIESLSAIVSKPLSSVAELREEYDRILEILAPMDDTAAIELLVSIAEKNGIDISIGAGNFVFPPPSVTSIIIGSTRYTTINFDSVIVRGKTDDVKAFIEDIDTGATIPNIAITRMAISESIASVEGDELLRIEEFQKVTDAVKEMMEDNQLDYIFNPVNVEGGKATNLMGDDPDTINITEGFPDSTTSLEQKGYTGDLYPRNGYVLYGHDKISPEDSANYTTVNYVDNVTTMYYYTCESTGVVRQWDNSIIEKASEYTDMDLTYDQLQIVLTIQIYTKPQ